MTDFLDQTTTPQQLDPGRILDTAEQFLEQCQHAEELARAFHPRLKKFDQIVICGMGGSAIGGDLLRAYAFPQMTVPLEVVRNYTLPGYVGKRTLVITGSYSGNTEETLACFQEAKKRGAQIVAITTGGTVGKWCEQDHLPYLTIPGGYAPRAALGYSFIPLLVLLEQWEVIPDQSKPLKIMYTTLKQSIQQNMFETPLESNPAKQLAHDLHGSIPVIYAGQDAMEPVAIRWRAQFNENTKCFAHNSVVPEMNHNEILAWKNPPAWVKKMRVVFLLDSGYHPQTTRRFQAMKKIIEPVAQKCVTIESPASELLARIMHLVNLGDFASIYLAYLYKQDPLPIPAIDQLKRELAS